MKTTAITVWNGIISPVFDAADTFLIIKDDGPEETIRKEASFPMELAGFLRQKKVAVVICGAISAMSLRLLAQYDIAVIPWIRGNVEAVRKAYRKGTLVSPPFVMPGCGRIGCRHGGRGRRRWRGHPFTDEVWGCI